MTDIIKSGVFVEGVEVTSEHIGRELVVVDSDTVYFTEGCSYPIRKVCVGSIFLLDADMEEDSLSRIFGGSSTIFKWEEVVQLPPPKLKSTPTSRKKMAKEIKEAYTNLQLAIANAEEHGMIVELEDDNIKISYQPPMEEY